MQKFVVGIIAILCLHVGFVAYFSTPDTAESAKIRESQLRPVLIQPPLEPVRDDEIIISRNSPTTTVSDEPAATVTTAPAKNLPHQPALAVERKTRADLDPRPVKAVNITPARTIPIVQTADYKVKKTEFPADLSFIAQSADIDTGLSAKTRSTTRTGKRSFLSKVGSIVKKPYDGLKAVASWLK